MIDKVVRNLLLTFFFCKMTKIINFLTTIIVKKKKICYNEFKLRNRKQKGVIMWVLGFILFMIFFYSNNSKKIKKLENKIKKLERKEKGNAEMSRLLQEMIGKEPIITGVYIGPDNWEVVMLMRNGSNYVVLIIREKKNSSCNVLKISKPLNLTESRCVTCN
ncbi:Uncharacterised protein [Streptococcus pneumoniae]|nr:Uncharacterised protein [Streptococcus pneumoniae]